MRMRTVGKIILENGKNVYKRFGAAAKQKIKLGTAAFANLVNNLTTTEEGSALDARVGPVIDGRLSKNEADISSLNSAMESVNQNVSSVAGTDTTALTSQTFQFLKSKWGSLPNNTINIITFTGTESSAIASCIYYKLNNGYGCAIVMSYYIARPIFVRLNDGVWYDPVRI